MPVESDNKWFEKLKRERTAKRNLDSVGFAYRIAKPLAEGGINNAEELRAKSDEELLAIEGIGPKRLTEIRTILEGISRLAERQTTSWSENNELGLISDETSSWLNQ